MAVKKFSAVVEFGGVVAGSMRSAAKTAKGDLSSVAASYQSIAEKQKMLKQYAGFDMKSLAASKRTMVETRKEVDRLGAEMRATGKPSAKLTRQFDAAQKKSDRAKKAYRSQSDTLASLNYKLKKAGINTKDLEGEFDRLATKADKARRKLDTFSNVKVSAGKFKNVVKEAGKVTGVVVGMATVVGGGIFALTDNVATLGDQTAKTADKLGFGLEALQEYRYAAERSGLSVGEFDNAAQRMVRTLGDAAKGKGAGASALKELGLDARELAGMKPEESLMHISDAMSGVDNATERVRLTFAIFGRTGVGMTNMLKNGSKELQGLRDRAHEVGYVLGEKALRDAENFKDKLLDTQTSITGFKNVIGAELMPVVTEFMDEITVSVLENGGVVKKWAKEFAAGVKENLPKVLAFGRGVVNSVTAVAGVVDRLATVVGGYENLMYGVVALIGIKAVSAMGLFTASIVRNIASVAMMNPALAAGVVQMKALWVAQRAAGAGAFASALVVGKAALLGATQAAWGFTTALLANPITWIVAGIAAAVAVVYRLVTAWDDLKKSFAKDGFFGAVKTFFGVGDNEEEKSGGVVKKMKGVTQATQSPPNTSYQAAREIPALPHAGGRNIKMSQRVGDIHIQTQPGQDPEAIAEAVHQRLQEKQQDALDRALYDPMTAGA
ncbi:hypothetical protein [Halodesulfovibrio aestuarii]|uniref:Phage tail tape measure protein n=1 Tax=Halodesulfovibrio aestuarii TaxID=126333 RepID=A0ABV4JVW9_9BACT